MTMLLNRKTIVTERYACEEFVSAQRRNVAT